MTAVFMYTLGFLVVGHHSACGAISTARPGSLCRMRPSRLSTEMLKFRRYRYLTDFRCVRVKPKGNLYQLNALRVKRTSEILINIFKAPESGE